MRKITLTAIALAATLAAGLMPLTNRAEAMVGTPASAATLATENSAPIETVSWCGWRCHRFHRFHHVYFHRFYHVYAYEPRFYHRPYFVERECRWC
jgi:hypothetical protein